MAWRPQRLSEVLDGSLVAIHTGRAEVETFGFDFRAARTQHTHAHVRVDRRASSVDATPGGTPRLRLSTSP